jgi:L-alanine-DL-glutamate epimerase-like enolase superfamily enzyme
LRLASVRAFDAALLDLYGAFLRERLGQGWGGARSSVSRWMRESEPRATRVAAMAE